ncbi:hypothetical protein CPU12_08430 [Malaciobacter molluscorum LMG 25693]|uniref:Dienelactone hydrolase domain-containing protein n=1 Tax=Malaciobacter molluscorum LMG 25693 TaxID=870501 RepID=A0A2G1DHF9_9BACT|nr:hypothetical protein [Malaciobacter molluscorum]AXX93371.1 hypothetical protein AMOL_2429 [Malaciobacter molluscorum LMG 25693]PHO17776.1 hypothetical protein CPU12_08430 [Malaciobacter molluscorum LMG 25693]
MKKIKKTINKYDNFEDTYKKAYIGLPKDFNGIKKPLFLTLDKFKKNHLNIKTKKKYPVLFFMHGSAGLAYGKKYKDEVLKENFIFFAPNSFKIKNRPTYKTPTKLKNYEQVHKLRLAEIFYNIKKLKEFEFIDFNNIFLMGSSEGAHAVSKYKGNEFKGRIIAAYSCEKNYYSNDFKIGAKKKDPILNIIGTQDEYFSSYSKYENKEVTGNCASALLKYKNAKVVILPKTKHNVIENQYTIPEVINFLKFHTKY